MHLVVFVGDGHWPVVQGVAHWNSEAAPLGRVTLVMVQGSDGEGRARGLERWVRETAPSARVDSTEIGDHPASVRGLLADVLGPKPDPVSESDGVAGEEGRESRPGTVVDLTALPASAWMGLTEFLGRTDVRWLERHPGQGWREFRSDAAGSWDVRSCDEIRRDETDGLSIPALVRSQFAKGECRYRFADPAPDGLPIVPLTQAGIRAGWRWVEAFDAVGLKPGGTGTDVLFGQYVAALVRSLGATNVLGGTWEHPEGSVGLVWILHGGRLSVLDLGGASVAEATPGSERSWVPDILRGAERARALVGLGVAYQGVRPGHRLNEVERDLAEARGLRIWDERDCHELPERLAQWLGVPVSEELNEVTRLLRGHLAEAGKARVFAEEAWVVREQLAGGGDPVLADVDTWLQRIQVVRGQNWMAWTHRNRIWIRVPAEPGRPDTAGEWRLMLAMVLGQSPEHVNAALRDQAVCLDLADQAEVRRRVSAWFRPFLNAPINFAAAQGRFAAEARIHTDTAPKPAARPAPVTRPAGPTGPAPRAASPASGRGVPAPRRSAGGGRPSGTVSGPRGGDRLTGLEDLDQALDGRRG